MIEEHAPLPPYLTLEEAAEAASSRLGQKWTARSILGCAARGEISIFARIHSACRLVRVEPLAGEENEIVAPAGHLPRISAKAVNALLAAGVATFDELTDLRTTEVFGEKFTEMATAWKIAEGDAAPEITPDNCRVMAYSLEQLADRYAAKLEADKGTTAKTNKLIWDDARLRALLDESNHPGVTHKSLGEKYGVSRSRIGLLLKDAREKFSIAKSSTYSQLMPGKGVHRGSKY